RLFREQSQEAHQESQDSWRRFVVAQTESSNAYIRTIALINLAIINFRDNAVRVLNEFHADTYNAIVTWKDDVVATVGEWYTETTEKWGQGLTDMSTALGEWLTSTFTSITEFDLAAAGESLIANFFSGITSYWEEHVAPWWTQKAQWIAD